MTGVGSATTNAVGELIRSWANDPDRGVIFDFNGTLSDDEPVLCAIFREMFAACGWAISPADYYTNLAGRSDREIVEVVAARHLPDGPPRGFVDEMLRDRRDLYAAEVAKCSPISAGSVALVRRLAVEGVPMAIVTGAQRHDVRCVLDASPVGEYVTLLVSEEDVARGKPDPEGYFRGADLLGLDPHHILVFEDSLPGFHGASSAGMPCVMVAGTQPAARLAEISPAVVQRLDGSVLDY